MTEVLTVLTFKSAEHLLSDGGTQSWAISRPRALACSYVVCARHRQGPWKPEGPEAHKHAFLVGRISGVEPSGETAGRWRVEFDEYALVDGPKLPLNSASPTQYFDSLKALGIDEAELDWQPVTRQPPAAAPAAAPRETAAHLSGAASVGKPLETPAAILMSAKALVAAQFGVAPEAVEISIRF